MSLGKKRIRRQPVIYRGYWARVRCLDQIIWSFLSKFQDQEVQILNFGGGMSTTFFRLCDTKPELTSKLVKFCDIDTPTVCLKKQEQMKRSIGKVTAVSELNFCTLCDVFVFFWIAEIKPESHQNLS